MATFQFSEQHGTAVKFSPLLPDLLAVTTTQIYGKNGIGNLFILSTDDQCSFLVEERSFGWSDGLLDVTWSKNNQNIILTSSLDGSMQLWNILAAENEKSGSASPLCVYKEHTAEIYSIDWITVNDNPQILSGSWDRTIKLWDPHRVKSLITYTDNTLIFSVSFSGSQRNIFCSVGSDGLLKLWSTNETSPVREVQISTGEVMSCDWSTCDDNLIVTGDSEGVIKVHDIRYLLDPLSEIHTEGGVALKKILFSPTTRDHIACAGYDGVTR